MFQGTYLISKNSETWNQAVSHTLLYYPSRALWRWDGHFWEVSVKFSNESSS